MKEIPENIKEIIIRNLSSEVSAEDHTLLEQWRRQSPEHEQEVAALSAIWKQSNEILKEPDFDTSRAWQAINSKTINPVKPKTNPVRHLVRILPAAALAGILLMGWWVQSGRKSGLSSITATATTANLYLTLPDSTNVWLRKGATIQYPETFTSKERKVKLNGEAFFDVKSAAGRPFRIQTAKSIVEVLGTTLLVQTTRQSDRVVLLTGKVSFADKANLQHHCILLPNQEALFTGTTFEKKPLSDTAYLFWQTDSLNFSEAPLKQVVDELAAYYRKPIVMSDSLLLKSGSITITARFRRQPLKEVLGEITMITGLQYRSLQDTIMIY